MTQQQWLERLTRQLVQQGLPRSYVSRCVSEFLDHFDDCELSNVDDRLATIGNPDDLAGSLVHSYRGSSWMRRVPWGIWCALSMPLAVATTLAFYYLAAVVFGQVERYFPEFASSESIQPITLWCFFIGKFAVPAIAVYLMLRILTSIGRPRWVWIMAVSTLTVSFLFVATEIQIFGPLEVDLSVTLGLRGFTSEWQAAVQVSQALVVPLIAIGSIAAHRSSEADAQPDVLGSESLAANRG